jgi:hypothetical protein
MILAYHAKKEMKYKIIQTTIISFPVLIKHIPDYQQYHIVRTGSNKPM